MTMLMKDIPQGKVTLTEAIAFVKQFAASNYSRDGWDIVVEAMDTAELTEIIGKARTRSTAVLAVWRVAKLLSEQRHEIQSTAF